MATRLEQPRRPASPIRYWSTRTARARQLARLEVRYPEVHLVFADSRRYAEDWTYRFLTTALADATDPSPNDG
jgi:hypothetical protein